MQPRMIAMFLFILLIYSAMNYYIGWHVTGWMDDTGISYQPEIFWPLLALAAFGFLIGRIRVNRPLQPLFRFIKVLGSYYIFVFEYSFVLFALMDIVRAALIPFGIPLQEYDVYAGAAVLIVLGTALLIGSRNAWNPIVRKHVLDVDKSAVTAKEWTIAAASDIHLGNLVGNRHLRRLVSRVNRMNPDLILLPGDVIDDTIEPFIRNRMSRTLGQLKAKHGVYAVLGNHEYYGGHIEQYIEQMRSIGITVLRDDKLLIADSLYVAGRKDKTAETAEPEGRLSAGELLAGLDKAKPVILMDHQPTKFQQAADAGADLLLCGHTHRGQFAPNHLFTRRLFELDWGYMMKEAMHVIVSSGFGSWGPPIRIGSRSEIIQITLRLKS
ncbi:phosphoesterase [Cohnella kolymensis]|uniref:Phosphoesterase n=2 Tax=Cohnella kolymensis TaxID=1590652 RepID=A0ABR5A2K3_9BACL|nr:phosphoesterase [Cohnella kolymensis]